MSAIRGSAWNLAGLILPLGAGLYAVPQIIHLLGDEQAGILMLIWGLIGSFSLFDFGLGRAVTQRMATHRAARRLDAAADAGLTAMGILAATGLVAAIIMLVLAPVLTRAWLRAGSMSAAELHAALVYVAWSLPIVVMTTGLRGVLEAENRFAASNIVRLPLGLWTFLSPVVATKLGADFSEVVLALVMARIVAAVAYGAMCMKSIWHGRIRRDEVAFMLGFGGWATVTNLAAPIMVHLDRYMIAYFVSGAAVAYYVTPYEIVMRIPLISQAVTAAYMPRFATLLLGESGDVRHAYRQAHHLVLVPTVAAAGFLFLFAEQFMSIWISPDFAAHSANLMKIMCIGAMFNAQALVPLVLLQAAAKPRLVALNHLVEMPIYLVVLWYAAAQYGLVGAAIACTARSAIDYLLMKWQSAHVPALADRRLVDFPVPQLLGVVVVLLVSSLVANGIAWNLFIFLLLMCWCAWQFLYGIRPGLVAPGEGDQARK